MTSTRFPRSVYGTGAEPDPRFSLANERTFLAWNRTALALIAGGVALEALGLDLQPGFRLAASLVLVVAGLAVPVLAWVEWARTERALRASAALPGSATSILLAITVVLVAVLVLFGILWR
ncbi:YidH family protein [Agromyces sp. NPDC056523]|uniref:YidH family protein n=1 Tax=Agromyces sp. NPDC056523 TaxID=3345850 RepID=UPI00366B0651